MQLFLTHLTNNCPDISHVSRRLLRVTFIPSVTLVTRCVPEQVLAPTNRARHRHAGDRRRGCHAEGAALLERGGGQVTSPAPATGAATAARMGVSSDADDSQTPSPLHQRPAPPPPCTRRGKRHRRRPDDVAAAPAADITIAVRMPPLLGGGDDARTRGGQHGRPGERHRRPGERHGRRRERHGRRRERHGRRTAWRAARAASRVMRTALPVAGTVVRWRRGGCRSRRGCAPASCPRAADAPAGARRTARAVRRPAGPRPGPARPG